MKTQSQQPPAAGNPLARGTGAAPNTGGIPGTNPIASGYAPTAANTPANPGAGGDPFGGHDPWDVAIGMYSNPAQTPAAPPSPHAVPTAPSPSMQPAITQNVQPAPASGQVAAPPSAIAPPPAPITPSTFDQSNSQLFPGGNVPQVMQQAQDAAYHQATGYLDPQFANQEAALRSQLANQGIMENSEAWNRAMDDFQRNKQLAYSSAENAAYGQGLTAQNQVANQVLEQLGLRTQQNVAQTGANASMYGSQLNAQTAANILAEQHSQNQYSDALGLRNQDINELLLEQQNPLSMANQLTGGQGVQSPNFTSTPGTNVDPTNIAQIIQQALGQQNNVYNTQVGATNSSNAGMATIIAALLSDRRLKTNIKQIGMHECGVPLYSYNYADGKPGFGVLADELEKVRPDAVWSDENGLKVVNYAAISKVDR